MAKSPKQLAKQIVKEFKRGKPDMGYSPHSNDRSDRFDMPDRPTRKRPSQERRRRRR